MDLHRITLVFLTALLMQYNNHMVRCVITDVQLVGGPSSNKGTVEIKQDGGDWETTCGMNLDFNDVIVICRQLGFTGASLATKITPYGQNSNPLIGLNCNGSEGNLSACPTFSPTSGCSSAGSASCHGERYLGCFEDKATDRVLSGNFFFYGTSISISYCIWVCRQSITYNFTYAGVESGNECYCGKAIDNYARHGVGVDSDCSIPCHGDPTESCGGPGYIAVFNISAAMTMMIMNTPTTVLVQNVETRRTTPPIGSTWSTEGIQEVTAPMELMTDQHSSGMTSSHSTKGDLTSSPMTTIFFSTLQQYCHSSNFGAVVGEGVVIILLGVLLIALVIYNIRIRRMTKGPNKDQKTQHVALFEASKSPEKDTGFYHDIQDVMKSDPTTTSDGDTYYSSQIYEQKRANVLNPNDTSAPHHSYMI